MTRAPSDLSDHEVAAALRDLGGHLDLGAGDTVEGRAASTAAVLARLDGVTTSGTGGPERRRPRLAVAAAIALVLGIALFSVAPAREAIASWFGVDGLRITRTDRTAPPPTGPDRGRPGEIGPADVADLVDRLPFELLLPSEAVAGLPVTARIDPDVPSGLIEVRYRDFTLVALASQPGGVPVLSKELGPATTVEAVTVDGEPGLWLTGAPHAVSFLDPEGEVVFDSIRRAGDVLLWQRDGVTYRVEGHTDLADAMLVATSLE